MIGKAWAAVIVLLVQSRARSTPPPPPPPSLLLSIFPLLSPWGNHCPAFFVFFPWFPPLCLSLERQQTSGECLAERLRNCLQAGAQLYPTHAADTARSLGAVHPKADSASSS